MSVGLPLTYRIVGGDEIGRRGVDVMALRGRHLEALDWHGVAARGRLVSYLRRSSRRLVRRARRHSPPAAQSKCQEDERKKEKFKTTTRQIFRSKNLLPRVRSNKFELPNHYCSLQGSLLQGKHEWGCVLDELTFLKYKVEPQNNGRSQLKRQFISSIHSPRRVISSQLVSVRQFFL